jgi:hypothetical protein
MIASISPQTWTVPRNSGPKKVVEHAYYSDGERVWCRVRDSWFNTTVYYSSKLKINDPGDYQENPPSNINWRKEPEFPW